MTQTQTQTPQLATWQGSPATYLNVHAQIAERWGIAEAENYNPLENCFTFNTWKQKGYHVKKGEEALHSHTRVPVYGKDDTGESIKTGSYPRNVSLFYILQVEKNTSGKRSN